MNKKNFTKTTCVIILSIIMLFANSENIKVEAASSEPTLGQISLMTFNFVPFGWAQCSGQQLQIAQNQALFSLIGNKFGGDGKTTFNLPDLREASPIPNTKYYIAVQGLYPSRDGGSGNDPTMGQIEIFPYDFIPGGWGECNGQIFNIMQNQALFSLLGNTFGGDGRTTFALPDLRYTEPDSKLHYCIALQGLYPNMDNGYSVGSDELIGSVNLFTRGNGRFDGDGLCNGGILNVAQNTPLFALIGAYYGGDGRTTFKKPDLRGAAPDPKLSYYVQTEGTFPSRE